MKRWQKIWVGPSPPDLDKIQKNSSFLFVTPSLRCKKRGYMWVSITALFSKISNVPGGAVHTTKWTGANSVCLSWYQYCRSWHHVLFLEIGLCLFFYWSHTEPDSAFPGIWNHFSSYWLSRTKLIMLIIFARDKQTILIIGARDAIRILFIGGRYEIRILIMCARDKSAILILVP